MFRRNEFIGRKLELRSSGQFGFRMSFCSAQPRGIALANEDFRCAAAAKAYEAAAVMKLRIADQSIHNFITFTTMAPEY